ncbi:MAG: flagellar biosynthetic protein FliO [Bdellovibrionota bacterium]
MDNSLLEVGFKMSVALGIVLLTFGGAVMIAKKFFGKGLPKVGSKSAAALAKGQIRIESTRVLGQGRNLHVVKFGEKILLIGATAQNISLISETVDMDEEENTFGSMLDSNHEENKEKSFMGQLGSRLKEISRV